MEFAAVMNSCDEKSDRVGLAALTEIERVVVLVSRANFEIELGGLSSFFFNSAGDHAVDTVAALEAVNASRAAAVLRTAITKFPDATYPTDRELRYPSLQKVLDSFDSLDAEIYREDPDAFSRLCSFMKTHEAELGEHAPDGRT